MGQIDSIFAKARAAERRGDMREARRMLEEVIERFPANARARAALARLEAEEVARREPDAATIAPMLASWSAGDPEATVEHGARIAATHPRSFRVHNLTGAAHLSVGRLEEAEAAFRRAIAADPARAAAHSNLALVLRRTGRAGEAEEALRTAAALDAAHADCRFNLASLLEQQGRGDEAIGIYEAALALEPREVEGWVNLGNCLIAALRPEAALTCYERALALDPAHPGARLNLGHAALAAGDGARAIAAFDEVAQKSPYDPVALVNKAKAYVRAGDPARAILALRDAMSAAPSDPGIRLHELHQRAQINDFSAHESFLALPLAAACGSQTTPVSPWAALSFTDDPMLLRNAARAFSARTLGPVHSRPLPAHPKATNGRLRVGYFTADFHDHATLYLLAGLLREHDRTRFEIAVYSYGPDRPSVWRESALAHVNRFVDLSRTGDADAVRLARSHGLDIAIDLKGHTAGTRSALFARGLAPVQIAWLGYPGTMGSAAYDYAVVDAVTMPEGSDRAFDEALIRLPHCYQPTDDARTIAPAAGGRAAHGLPEAVPVFACFNHGYKIGPAEWQVWMDLMRDVPGSVLWLLEGPARAQTCLRAEARDAGIDPTRLVFAPHLPQAEHLGRLALADLFLDTFRVNAHTSGSDALWAGLPVLTLPGRSFASRVGASLVTAAGLADVLVAHDEADYAARARALVRDRAALTAIRERLAAARTHGPLFDTAGFARDFEAALAIAHTRACRGLEPVPFAIAPPPLPETLRA